MTATETDVFEQAAIRDGVTHHVAVIADCDRRLRQLAAHPEKLGIEQTRKLISGQRRHAVHFLESSLARLNAHPAATEIRRQILTDRPGCASLRLMLDGKLDLEQPLTRN